MKNIFLTLAIMLTFASCDRIKLCSDVIQLFFDNLNYVDYVETDPEDPFDLIKNKPHGWYIFYYNDKIDELLHHNIMRSLGTPTMEIRSDGVTYVYQEGTKVNIIFKKYIMLQSK